MNGKICFELLVQISFDFGTHSNYVHIMYTEFPNPETLNPETLNLENEIENFPKKYRPN